MSLMLAFWDSSAIIPLCTQQAQTERATALFDSRSVVVWWSTRVEVISGLKRLLRMGEIDEDEFRTGKQLALTIATNWVPIAPSAKIAAQACSLLELYPLSAADALQLAAALEWSEGKPEGKVFLSFDQRLREAARLAGFTVE
jgi:predicted nucleic acid-binding protein